MTESPTGWTGWFTPAPRPRKRVFDVRIGRFWITLFFARRGRHWILQLWKYDHLDILYQYQLEKRWLYVWVDEPVEDILETDILEESDVSKREGNYDFSNGN